MDDSSSVSSEAMVCLLTQSLLMQSRVVSDEQLAARTLAELIDTDDPVNVFHAFSGCVFAGVTPPPHLLAFAAEAFKRYLISKGDISLDQAFGRDKVNGKKHPLRQKLKDDERNQVYLFMWDYRKRNGGKIYEAAAEGVAQFKLHIGAASLEKAYIKSKVEKMLDDAHALPGDDNVDARFA